MLTLTFVGASVLAQSETITEKQKQAAQKGFTNGLHYYLWHAGAEPITGETLALATPVAYFSVKYGWLAKDDTANAAYRVRVDIVALDDQNKTRHKLTTFMEAKRAKGTISGEDVAQFTWTRELVGEGYADISLVEAKAKPSSETKSADADEPEPRSLSNTFRVRVKFGK